MPCIETGDCRRLTGRCGRRMKEAQTTAVAAKDKLLSDLASLARGEEVSPAAVRMEVDTGDSGPSATDGTDVGKG
jgi:hypothetical protein